MVEPSETVHQTIPYVQIQPDWNVILDTIRLYGMLKKTVSSKLPKTFTSVGINGEEIEIQLPDEPFNSFWLSFYRYDETEECSQSQHVTITAEYDASCAESSFIKLTSSHPAIGVVCSENGKLLTVSFLSSNQQTDGKSFVLGSSNFLLPLFKPSSKSTENNGKSPAKHQSTAIALFRTDAEFLEKTGSNGDGSEGQNRSHSMGINKETRHAGDLDTDILLDPPGNSWDLSMALDVEKSQAAARLVKEQLAALQALFAASGSVLPRETSSSAGSFKGGSIQAIDTNSLGEILVVGEYINHNIVSSGSASVDEARVAIVSPLSTTPSSSILPIAGNPTVGLKGPTTTTTTTSTTTTGLRVTAQHSLDPNSLSRSNLHALEAMMLKEGLSEDERSHSTTNPHVETTSEAEAETEAISDQASESTRSPIERKEMLEKMAALRIEAHKEADGAGHWGAVTACHWLPVASSQNSLYLTGGVDSSVRLWARDHPRPIRTLRGHGRRVTSVLPLQHSGGKQIASTSMDGTLKIWDIASSQCITTKSHGDLSVNVNVNVNVSETGLDLTNSYLDMCSLGSFTGLGENRSSSASANDVLAVGTSRTGLAIFDLRIPGALPTMICPIFALDRFRHSGDGATSISSCRSLTPALSALHIQNYQSLSPYLRSNTPKMLIPTYTATDGVSSVFSNISYDLFSGTNDAVTRVSMSPECFSSHTNSTSTSTSTSHPSSCSSSSHIIYCGTQAGVVGVVDLRKTDQVFTTINLTETYRASSSPITAMKLWGSGSEQSLFVGNDDGELMKWNRRDRNDETSSFSATKIYPSTSKTIVDVALTGSPKDPLPSTIWVATEDGLRKFDP